jgi:predicted peptidase
MRRGLIVAALLAISLSMPTTIETTSGFLNRILQSGGSQFRYQVYVPVGWKRSSKWPVLLFLHGAGERGDDGLLQTNVGIGSAIRRYVDRFQCLVVFPQCRKDTWWTAPEMEEQALKALDLTIKEFKCDISRVYLTGISMGGYGAWDIAQKQAGRFAAIAVVCGGIKPPPGIKAPEPAASTEPGGEGDPYAATAKRIGSTPAWVFHGAADPIVPVTESREMVEAIRAAGGDVKYTEYPAVGHNSWDKAFCEHDFMRWLLSHKITH